MKRTFVPALQADDGITYVLLWHPIFHQRMWINPANPAENMRNMGLYEKHIRMFIQNHLNKGDTFLDIGACIGDHSIAASIAVGQTGSVHAFEPDPRSNFVLRENAGITGSNIKVYGSAIGNENGEAKLHLADSMGTSFVSNRGYTIHTERLDDWAVKHGVTPNMIKVDTEGFEGQVLEGGRETFSKAQWVIIEPHPYRNGLTSFQCIDLLKELGFTEFFRADYHGADLRKFEIDNENFHVFAGK